MFFVLSKLLPLLVYPLGLACLGAIAALIWLRTRPRRAAVAIAASLAVLLLAGNGWVSAAIVRSLETRYLPADPVPTADAIVVLGGATRSALSPRPWIEVNEAGDRILYAAKLYREGKAPRLVLSGGRVDWLGGGAPESADLAALAMTMGVPERAILQEPRSRNTYENAVNTREILEREGIDRILLVTSALHVPRALAIFKHQDIDAIPAPTDFLIVPRDLDAARANWQAIALNLLPSADRLELTTRALKEYLGTFVYWLKGWL